VNRVAEGDDRDEEVDLAELFSELAGDLDELEVAEGPDGVEYRRRGRAFSAVDARGAEFRLRPEVTQAVLRTPAVARSGRGGDWVRFAPESVDRFALDRAEAWFLSAWRLAGER
jgi:hypothetical protein